MSVSCSKNGFERRQHPPSAFRYRHGHFRDQRHADARADHLHQRRQRAAIQPLARQGRLVKLAKGQRLIAEAMPLLQQQQAHFAKACRGRGRVGPRSEPGRTSTKALLEQRHLLEAPVH
jgi:hypothetical protein